MRLLAIETSTEWCSVAVGDGAHWHLCDEHAGQAHSERLLPMVDAALAEVGWALRDLDGLAFGAGPGSFTGIRIGCGVTQGLALGADLPVVPVPTLAALAQDAFRARGWTRVLACLDARMREVYVASYARAGGLWREVAAPSVVPPAEVPDPRLDGEGVWFGAGNGFAAYPALGAGMSGLAGFDPSLRVTARAIAELALADHGVLGDADQAFPHYVRDKVAMTAAERAGAR